MKGGRSFTDWSRYTRTSESLLERGQLQHHGQHRPADAHVREISLAEFVPWRANRAR
jgi:hypothetical protein